MANIGIDIFIGVTALCALRSTLNLGRHWFHRVAAAALANFFGGVVTIVHGHHWAGLGLMMLGTLSLAVAFYGLLNFRPPRPPDPRGREPIPLPIPEGDEFYLF